jgi:hypothetical protein
MHFMPPAPTSSPMSSSPASAENTKSVSATGVPQNVPARLGTHSPFKDGRIAFEQSRSIASQIGVKLRTLVS